MVKNKTRKDSRKSVESTITGAVYKNYSLQQREVLNRKDVKQLFATMHSEKKKPVQY